MSSEHAGGQPLVFLTDQLAGMLLLRSQYSQYPLLVLAEPGSKGSRGPGQQLVEKATLHDHQALGGSGLRISGKLTGSLGLTFLAVG